MSARGDRRAGAPGSRHAVTLGPVQRLRAGHELQEFRRDLALPGLTRVPTQFFQLLRHVVMGRPHYGQAGRVFAGERFDRGFG